MENSKDPLSSIPAALNLGFAAVHVLLNLYQLFILPIFLLPVSAGWLLTLVPIAALANSFWSLIHEAIHDLFSPSRRINTAAGRLLAIFFGSPFRVLRISHLLHHKLNRSPVEATEVYDPEKTSKAHAGLGYYFQILGGLYLLEVVSAVPFFLPRRILRFGERRFFKEDSLGGSLAKSLMRDEAIGEMRADGLASFTLLGVSAVCYGERWPWLVLVLLVRGFLISFLDNVYHYKTPMRNVFYARNLWLPRFFSKTLLYFNLHGVHHRNPTLPWIRLPEIFARQGGRFDGNYFAAALGQLSGPLPMTELPDGRSTVTDTAG